MEKTYCENCKILLNQREKLGQKIKDLRTKVKVLVVEIKDLEEDILPKQLSLS